MDSQGGDKVYTFFAVKIHQIFIESLPSKDCSDMTSFPAKSSYSLHLIGLKLGGQLDHEVVSWGGVGAVTSYIWHSTDVLAEWPVFSTLPGI